jgi:hypothetical protein
VNGKGQNSKRKQGRNQEKGVSLNYGRANEGIDEEG